MNLLKGFAFSDNRFFEMGILTAFGSIGLGLVWGWLLGKFDSRIARPGVVGLSLAGATAAWTGELFWLAGLVAVPYFLCGALVTVFLHTQCRKELRKRQHEF